MGFAILVSLVVGILQAVILKKLLNSVLKQNFNNICIYLCLKFIVYAVGIALVFLVFRKFLLHCAIGFTLGLPVGVILWFVFKAFRKGDGKNEAVDNN